VSFVKERGWLLNSSLHTSNWEFITACAVIQQVPLRLYLSEKESFYNSDLIKDFNLDTPIVDFINLRHNFRETDNESWLKNRDDEIVQSSDMLIPISIRAGGHMARLIEQGQSSGKEVINTFRTNYVKSKNPMSYKISGEKLTDEIKQMQKEYIVHWTRASNGPWPNESKFDFYSSVLNSKSYPRSAWDTLRRIALTREIIASTRHMPERTPTVSYSELAPVEAIKLMKWRARYCQMTFEPYGIGIEVKTALESGVRKVSYRSSKSDNLQKSVPAWLTQSQGQITDWRKECEFRSLGNFNFAEIAIKKLALFCRFKSEANKLEREFGIKTYWFCD
jgi:hypothetical protein